MSESPFAPILAKTGQPEPVVAHLRDKLNGLFDLITRHNSRVLRIQQTKAADPSNTEMLDEIWNTKVESGDAPAEIKTLESEYQEAVEVAEKLLAKLREFAVGEIKPPLTPDQMESERHSVNEEAKLIAAETAGAKVLAEMADTMLGDDNKVSGGIFSLMPEVKSLKGGRGRGSSSNTSTGSYRTRIDTVEMDGELVFRERTVRGEKVKESNLQHAADKLNAKWNADRFPENGISDETLERQMYAAHNAEFRDSKALPVVVEFDFTKDVKRQNPNDDSTTTIPETVHFKVTRNVGKSSAAQTAPVADAKEENKSSESDTEENKASESENVNSEPTNSASTESSEPTEAKETAKVETPAANSKAAILAAKKAAAKK